MSKKTSKSARWSAAIAAALEALATAKDEFVEAADTDRDPNWDVIICAAKDFKNAAEDAESVRGEYEEWLYSMPESLQSSATGEKLYEIVYCEGIDIDPSWIEMPRDTADLDAFLWDVEESQNLFEELEALDVPLGFGRD